MSDRKQTPFESVEGAQEYLSLLAEAVRDAREEVAADIGDAGTPEPSRRLEALRLVLFKLENLERHVKSSRRLLNDLRSLRRLLLGERPGTTAPKTGKI